jgi:hypothetical protein
MADPAPEPNNPAAPTSADLMASLKLHMDLANSEKQAIWARHATMLVGNSLIVNAVRSDVAKIETATTLFLNGAGLALCIVWAIMTWNGWGWFYKSLLAGKNVPIDPSLNPFASMQNIAQRRTDSIFILAMLVVLIFASVYLVGLWPLAKSMSAFICGT